MSILSTVAASDITVSDSHQPLRKRKRDDHPAVELDTRPFTIRADPSDPFAKPRIFTPVALLPRANLPLACLDSSSSGSRLFSAHIHILEASHEDGLSVQVLIAQGQAEKRLYAIERTKSRTYVLCRLGTWFTCKEVEALGSSPTVGNGPQAKRQALEPVDNNQQPWWSRAVVETPASLSLNGPTKLCMLATSFQEDSMSRAGLLPPAEATLCEHSSAKNISEPPMQDVNAESHLSTEHHFQELAKHYLDALYLSRTSLAYFTKGPLSRIRAAFTNATNGLPIQELITFLRDATLSSAVADKKYREGIPDTVRELAPGMLATPEQPVKAKSKRKWKSKRDKYGYFSNEKAYVEQCWLAEAGDGLSVTGLQSANVQKRISVLRSRETYLQIILALEVLALEASPLCTPQVLTNENSDGYISHIPELQSNAREGKSTKFKKLQDLPALLGTLVDKLCIWHSLDTHSPAKGADSKVGVADSTEKDDLRDFCIEVVIPFYMSRTPEHASTVNKKLGGPSAASPGKRKTGSRRPGEPAMRQPPEKKPRAPLARVSTDTLNQDVKRVPSLHRSATDSVVPKSIKRESSEAPLDSIPPLSHPVPARRKRTSLMHSMSFSKREVDLSAMSQANRTKLRKKAEVEEKLKEAISTLKKPNRELAVKEVAESADLSFAKATAKARPSYNSRTKTSQGADVAATPKHVRAVKATPYKRAETTSAQENLRSSGTSCVPSTSARVAAQAPGVPESIFAVPQTGHRQRHGATNIEDTPSRGFAKFMPLGLKHSPGTLVSPTATRRTAAVEQTPSKPVRSISMAPLVPTSADPARVSSAPGPNGKEEHINGGSTIYDALGWDDEYENLA